MGCTRIDSMLLNKVSMCPGRMMVYLAQVLACKPIL